MVSEFYKAVDPVEPAKWNLSLFEGQFVKELVNATQKEKREYYHSVSSKKFAEIFIKESLDTLVCEMLPFINQFEDVAYFQNFVNENTSYLKENFENTEFFVSALLLVKLTDKRKFEHLYFMMKDLLSIEKQNGRNYSKHIFYLEQLNSFN